MDTTSCKAEKGQAVVFLEETVECPKYKAVCCSITLAQCVRCPAHRGVVEVTEIRGVKVRDVLCGLPVNKRIMRLIREVPDGSSE